jgi:uncharacterized MAPEG superfamily protein
VNLTPAYIFINWAWAFVVLTTRLSKKKLGLDHNVNPREDLDRAEAAVAKGKITRQQLNGLRRREAAHANSIENFPVYIAAILSAYLAGVSTATLNGLSLWFTLSRIVYGIAYINTESYKFSFIRSLCWWSGNFSCITGLVLALRAEFALGEH